MLGGTLDRRCGDAVVFSTIVLTHAPRDRPSRAGRPERSTATASLWSTSAPACSTDRYDLVQRPELRRLISMPEGQVFAWELRLTCELLGVVEHSTITGSTIAVSRWLGGRRSSAIATPHSPSDRRGLGSLYCEYECPWYDPPPWDAPEPALSALMILSAGLARLARGGDERAEERVGERVGVGLGVPLHAHAEGSAAAFDRLDHAVVGARADREARPRRPTPPGDGGCRRARGSRRQAPRGASPARCAARGVRPFSGRRCSPRAGHVGRDVVVQRSAAARARAAACRSRCRAPACRAPSAASSSARSKASCASGTRSKRTSRVGRAAQVVAAGTSSASMRSTSARASLCTADTPARRRRARWRARRRRARSGTCARAQRPRSSTQSGMPTSGCTRGS